MMRFLIFITTTGLLLSDLSAQTRFTNVTAASGIVLNPKHLPGQPQYGTQKVHGVAVEDFDKDGRLDILVVCFGEPHVQLFRNLGNLRFADVTKDSGLETFQGRGTGAAVGDYDRDGNLDVYLTSVQGEKPSRLFRGLGNGRFVDVSKKSGTLLSVPGRSCAWSDVDGDGWLDLFIACPHNPSVLFHNNRNGTFTNIAKEAGVQLDERASLGCAFGDIDGDGNDDLCVTNYYSQVSAIFKNLGNGKFREITKQAGIDRKASAVGCAFADVQNRGILDLFVTTDSWLSGENATEEQLLKKGKTVEPNLLYLNDGKGKFTPTKAKTLLHKTLSHDVILEDLDHDGWVNVYVGVDAIPSGNRFATHKGGNPLWTRPDGKAWKEARKEWGVGFEGNCVCVPAADFDNDGDLDLLLINFYKNLVLYRNNTNDKNWLRIKAIGEKSNRDGIGAKIRLYSSANDKLIGMRHVQSGAGYGRSSPLEAHFGLGRSSAKSYRIEVTFSSGIVRTRKNVTPGQRITVHEMEKK